MARLLVVDDEDGVRDFVAEALELAGHDVTRAGDGDEAARLLDRQGFDLVVTDLRMPGRDGMALLTKIKDEQPDVEVIVLTAHGTIDTAVAAMKAGAFEYLQKPLGSPTELRLVVGRALERRALLAAKASAERQAGDDGDTLTWGAPAMAPLVEALRKVAATSATVLLLGESGTGKEVVARELHRLSGRRGAFSAVNCAAIPATLIESELFGYKRGAFSGADRDKPGLIKSAHEGTLLLDEIGDMPLEAQAKLLRVLQAKEVFPLGATAPERVDVRVICATHRDLWRLQQGGSFRQDLFARLNEYQLRLPALRERKEDVFMLVRAFLARHGRQELTPSFGFMTAALQYDWPYNVRELEACIKRCVALAESTVLGDQLLPAPVIEAMEDYGDALRPGTGTAPGSLPPPPPSYEPPSRSQVPTDAELRALLEQHGGNVAAVGRQLGKARMQVHRWMKRYGIHVDDFRRG